MQSGCCGGGDKRLCDGLWTTELQWQVFLRCVVPFLSPSNQSARSQFIEISLSLCVWCSTLKTLVWCYRFFCSSAFKPVTAPSHSLSICMATLYQASCCCPFLSSCWILIITFKGKRLQSSFIKCPYWEEASRCPTPTQAAPLHLNTSDLQSGSNLPFQVWTEITYGRRR